jgi:hypothetical protein
MVMDRFVKLLDASVIATLLTGFIYMLGYRYLYAFYQFFGLSFSVASPDIAFVLSQGFDFLGWFGLVLVVTGLVHVFIQNMVMPYFKSKASQGWYSAISSATLLITAAAFVTCYLVLDDHIRENAITISKKSIASRKALDKSTVILTTGEELKGHLRFFFFGPLDAVFMDFQDTNSSSPRIVVVSRSQLKYLTTNNMNCDGTC